MKSADRSSGWIQRLERGCFTSAIVVADGALGEVMAYDAQPCTVAVHPRAPAMN